MITVGEMIEVNSQASNSKHCVLLSLTRRKEKKESFARIL